MLDLGLVTHHHHPNLNFSHLKCQYSDGKRPSMTFLNLPLPSMTFYNLLWPSLTFYHLLRPLWPSMIYKMSINKPSSNVRTSPTLHSSPVQINSPQIQGLTLLTPSPVNRVYFLNKYSIAQFISIFFSKERLLFVEKFLLWETRILSISIDWCIFVNFGFPNDHGEYKIIRKSISVNFGFPNDPGFSMVTWTLMMMWNPGTKRPSDPLTTAYY